MRVFIAMLLALMASKHSYSDVTDITDDIAGDITDDITGAADSDGTTSLPSMSVMFRQLHQPSESTLYLARVNFSSQGLRVRQLYPDSSVELIARFSDGRIWLVDHHSRQYHDVPRKIVAGSGKQSESQASEGFQIGFIDTRACRDLQGIRQGHHQWRGRTIEKWECSLPDGNRVATQYFDAELGLLVRAEYLDGVDMQLYDFASQEFHDAYFKPPSEYQNVEFDSLLARTPKLDRYIH